jgi:hypothetical protein
LTNELDGVVDVVDRLTYRWDDTGASDAIERLAVRW